jgi:hypothetical protein
METLEEEPESLDEQELSSDDDSSDGEFEHRENRASEKANAIAIVSSKEQDGANELQDTQWPVLERTKTRHHHSSSLKHTKSAKKSLTLLDFACLIWKGNRAVPTCPFVKADCC